MKCTNMKMELKEVPSIMNTSHKKNKVNPIILFKIIKNLKSSQNTNKRSIELGLQNNNLNLSLM